MSVDHPRGAALITGASSGFGLLSAIELARHGFRVFGSMRDLSRQEPLLAAAAEVGVSVETVELDVTSAASIERAVAEVHARAGAIDLLVNNAGIGVIAAFEDTSDAELRAIFETNVFGLAAVARAVIPGMRARRRGRIVNVASVGGRIGSPGVAAYSASKFAVEGLSEVLSLELAPFGIDVAIVEPGFFRTEMVGPAKRTMTPRAADPASPYHARCAAIDAFMQHAFDHGGPDPRDVARTIARAATDRRPRLRYPVGGDARLFFLLKRLLPARGFERVSEWLFNAAVLRKHGPAARGDAERQPGQRPAAA
jgi:NAD(P)-dependent dehydrogenase (short-subunit alcohol dehydrogenase family)